MKRFLGIVFKHFIGMWLALVLAFSLLLGCIAGVLVGLFYEPYQEIKDKSVLIINLGSPLKDSPDESSPRDWLEILVGKNRGEGHYLLEVLQAINRAKTDKRIEGILLKGASPGNMSGAGFVQLSEIRNALENFTEESNKPVVAFLENPRVDELYLASVSDEIVLDPFGEVLLNGLGVEQMYFAKAFKKYGIGIQVTKVGKYKTGIEPFIRENMSNEEKEQTGELLGTIWKEILEKIGESRSVTPEKLKEISQNQGVLLSADAKKFGLIDDIGYYENAFKDFFDDNPDNNDTETINKTSLRDYIKESEFKNGLKKKTKIAVLYIEGAMVDGEGQTYEAGGDRLSKKLNVLKADDNVKAVVIRVNSPGGSATAAEKIQREIRSIMKEKPVVISMGDYAASGGYWVSAYSNHLYANPLTITGSIGVYGIIFNVRDIAESYGIKFDRVLTGELADIESMTKPKSEREMSVLQRTTQFIYNVFIHKVAEGRDLKQDHVKALAGGRVWSGKQALKKGLIDDFGGLQQAIDHAAELAELEAGTWSIKQVPEAGEFIWDWMEDWVNPEGDTGILAHFTYKVQLELRQILHMNDPKGVYALWLYKLR